MQRVEFVTMRTTRKMFDDYETFTYRKDRALPWLQRLCFYVLRKLSAFKEDYTISITRHTVNAPTFMQRLLKQHSELLDQFYREPKILLIGSEDYAELMQEAATNREYSFRAEYNLNRTVYGLEVRIIPWMQGFILLPEGY